MLSRSEAIDRMVLAIEALGPWLCASVDGETACDEYKLAALNVLDALHELRGLE